MTILTALQNAAPFIGIARPDAVYASTDEELIKLGILANRVAKEIAFDRGHDWTVLKTLATITGDGSAASFALPAEYKRMIKTARLWPSATPSSPLRHIVDTDVWEGIEVQDFDLLLGAWTIIGTSIYIKPTVALSDTVKYYYITNLIVDAASGGNKTSFTLDTDTFLLDERMIELGVIAQWKAAHGQSCAKELQDYENCVSRNITDDKGSRLLRFGGGKKLVADEIALPFSVGP